MKLAFGGHIFNTNNCVKHRDCIRVTVDRLSPRVYCKKEEVLCHQKQNSYVYFNWVKVYKYIDENCVASFEWLQDVEPDELKDFLLLKEQNTTQNKINLEKPEPKLTPDEKHELKKQRNREYYYKHREEQLAKKKEYYRQNRKQQNNYSRQYYQEHKDTWKEKYLSPKK